jgi:hypothetical protein
LQELSPGTSRFPGGQVIYVYGSLLFDYLSRTRGPASIRDFVERGSKSLIPFILTPTSRSAFGLSFQTAWEQFRDSLVREMRAPHEVMPGWRRLTTAGRVALFPRWLGDTALVYGGDKGREMGAAYVVDLAGREKNLGRRNAPSPNVRMPDGNLLFSQPDYIDAYHIRSDLFVQRARDQIRLTSGARLSAPDVRADGEIVAVQSMPATTRLVRISADGKTLVPLTPTGLDVQWAEPRWSPDGSRVAAVRQSRGRSEVVILDSGGKVIDSFGGASSINSDPSWSPDGRSVYFSSERSGLPQIYVADVTMSAPNINRITDAATGVFAPEVAPDQTQLATLLYEADGFHLGVAPLSSVVPLRADSTTISPRANCQNCISLTTGLPPLGTVDSARATEYSPWPALLPRYWFPVLESTTGDGTSFGATTSGYDVVARHQYTASFIHNTRFGENTATLFYRYAGFGLPLIDVTAFQDYSHGVIQSTTGGQTVNIGYLSERSRTASLQATIIRPRFRNYSVLSLGGEVETIDYSTDPDTLLPHLSPFFQETRRYPAVIATFGFANTQRPALSISQEDGVSMTVNGRARWQSGGSGSATQSVIGVGTAFKSLDLPGFAHHVLALRAAGGVTDQESPDRFSAGGTSGTLFEIFPGYYLGNQRRTFGVRGYPAGAESGIRAYSAALEYRAPIFAASRGFRYIPVFVDRGSVTIFGETGRAWCPSVSTDGVCRAQDVDNPSMTSTGAELILDTWLVLDIQAKFRMGVAFPLTNREQLGANGAQFYATFGASF